MKVVSLFLLLCLLLPIAYSDNASSSLVWFMPHDANVGEQIYCEQPYSNTLDYQNISPLNIQIDRYRNGEKITIINRTLDGSVDLGNGTTAYYNWVPDGQWAETHKVAGLHFSCLGDISTPNGALCTRGDNLTCTINGVTSMFSVNISNALGVPDSIDAPPSFYYIDNGGLPECVLDGSGASDVDYAATGQIIKPAPQYAWYYKSTANEDWQFIGNATRDRFFPLKVGFPVNVKPREGYYKCRVYPADDAGTTTSFQEDVTAVEPTAAEDSNVVELTWFIPFGQVEPTVTQFGGFTQERYIRFAQSLPQDVEKNVTYELRCSKNECGELEYNFMSLGSALSPIVQSGANNTFTITFGRQSSYSGFIDFYLDSIFSPAYSREIETVNSSTLQVYTTNIENITLYVSSECANFSTQTPLAARVNDALCYQVNGTDSNNQTYDVTNAANVFSSNPDTVIVGETLGVSNFGQADISAILNGLVSNIVTIVVGYPQCNEDNHSHCSQYSYLYSPAINYSEYGSVDLFCGIIAGDTQYDWHEAESLADFAQQYPDESCGNNIDNNCDAINYFAYDGSVINYSQYVEGGITYTVYEDPDAFDPQCAANINITVEDIDTQQPLVADLRLYFDNPQKAFVEYRSATTDANGVAMFNSVPASNYTLVASSPNYESKNVEIDVPYQQTKNVTVRLGRSLCNADCTYDNGVTCDARCDGVNGCLFGSHPNESVPMSTFLNGTPVGSVVTFTYDAQLYEVAACESEPKLKGDDIPANIGCDGQIAVTREVVDADGRRLKLVTVVGDCS